MNAQTINRKKYSTTLLDKIRQLHRSDIIISVTPRVFFPKPVKKEICGIETVFHHIGRELLKYIGKFGRVSGGAILRREIATSRRTQGSMVCNRQLANVPELLKEPPRLREAASTHLKSRNFQNGQSRAKISHERDDRKNNIQTPLSFLVLTASRKFYEWTIDFYCQSIENLCYVSETSKEANL